MSTADPENAPECIEGPEAYDRFKALTRKLVRVPKDELDRKRAEEKARKG